MAILSIAIWRLKGDFVPSVGNAAQRGLQNPGKTTAMMDPGDQFLEYVFNRCARDEVYTVDKERFDKFFKGDPEKIYERIEDFCLQHALNFFVNVRKRTYTFSLVDGD